MAALYCLSASVGCDEQILHCHDRHGYYAQTLINLGVEEKNHRTPRPSKRAPERAGLLRLSWLEIQWGFSRTLRVSARAIRSKREVDHGQCPQLLVIHTSPYQRDREAYSHALPRALAVDFKFSWPRKIDDRWKGAPSGTQRVEYL